MISSDIVESTQYRRYFSYGMLCDPELMPESQHIRFLGKAVLPGYRFEIMSYANVIPDTGSKVLGCLWSVTYPVLSMLDDVENVPWMYSRIGVNVVLGSKTVRSQLYVMTPDYRKRAFYNQPSKSYVDRIARGYRNARIPLTQLQQGLNDLIERQKQ